MEKAWGKGNKSVEALLQQMAFDQLDRLAFAVEDLLAEPSSSTSRRALLAAQKLIGLINCYPYRRKGGATKLGSSPHPIRKA